MSGLLSWWRQLTLREQRLLQVMLALLTLVVAWLAVVRPLSDALDAARQRHGAAVVALAEAQARAEAADRNPERRPPVPLPVDALVGRTASESGFANARIASQGPASASVAIEAARPQAVFGWMASLEARGLSIAMLRARANQDQTIAVEAQFRAPAR